MEILFVIDDLEFKFENCEFLRFRIVEGLMKFCWKEDLDELLILDGVFLIDDWKFGLMNCWGIGVEFLVFFLVFLELKNEEELFVCWRILRMFGIRI